MNEKNSDRMPSSKRPTTQPQIKESTKKFAPTKNVPSDSIPIHLNAPKKPFTYQDFKLIAEKGPFTIVEWGQILHMSERTIHRYAIENSEFNGLHIERVLHVEKLIDKGINYLEMVLKLGSEASQLLYIIFNPKNL